MKNKAVILENEISSRDLLAEHLKELGYEVKVVSGGLAGLDTVYEYKPHLIFLNPSAQDISDYQICNLLKNKEEYRNIPIIVLVDKPQDRLRFWNIKNTADSYLLKPFDKETLPEQLKHLVKRFSRKVNLISLLEYTERFDEILRQLALVYQDNLDLNSHEIQNIFQQLIEVITALLRSEIGSLMLVDKMQGEEKILILKAACGLSRDIIQNTKVKIGEGICGWVAENNHPLLVRDIEKDNNFCRQNNDKYYTKSFISAPVHFADVRGVINVNNKINKKLYNSEDLSLLSILVNQINFAFEQAVSRTEISQVNKKFNTLERMNKILIEANQFLDRELYQATISNEINKIITANLDYRQTLNAVMEIIEQLIDYHFCGLLLVDEESHGEIIISIKYPAAERQVEKFKMKVIESFNELTNKIITKDKVMLNRSDGFAIITADIKNEEDIVSSFQAQLLHNAQKVIGLLAISHSKKDAFKGKNLNLFSTIVQRSIPAINNAALHRKIKELSNRDDLTGLYRYGYLQDQLERELVRADRYRSSLGIIMLDVDSFKQVNDVHGHHQGDIILKELSSILKKICRNVDIIARYGGEEFVIILPETDKDGAFYLAERMRRVVKNYDFSSTTDTPIKLTISLGVVSYPASAASKLELLKKADAALYQAKEGGKNATCQI